MHSWRRTLRTSYVGRSLELMYLVSKRELAIRREEPKVPRLIVFGHQKSGTSFVAEVVAQVAEVPARIDLPVERIDPSLVGNISAEALIHRSWPYSSATIVKEPHWTPFAPEFMNSFEDLYAVGVKRDPVKIIESICFRLSLPARGLEGMPPVERSWRPILAGHGLTDASPSALENLARRIGSHEQAMEVASWSGPERWTLVDYDAFRADPVTHAREVAKLAGMPSKGQPDLNRQYQPGLRSVDSESREQFMLDEAQQDVVRRLVAEYQH